MIISENPRLALTSLSAAAPVMPYSLRIGEGRYRMDEAGRSDIAEQLGLVDARRTVPEGVEWPTVDGEPVVPSDVLWDEHGERVTVEVIRCAVNSTKASCYVGAIDEGGTLRSIYDIDGYARTEPPKRVLDRDGVAIEVGDTVYLVNLDFPMEVHDIHDGPGSYHTVECITEPGHTVGYDPGRLTHERPDSWRRLEEDAGNGNSERYWGCEDRRTCADCPATVDGRTPDSRYRVDNCDVAMALDIVRRAKAIAGVVGDE